MSRGAARVRAAAPADVPAITAIYNDAVLHTTATFDTRPRTDGEQAAWLARHGAGHPVLVATEAGEVVGWACLSPWSDRPAYEATAEDSGLEEWIARGLDFAGGLPPK